MTGQYSGRPGINVYGLRLRLGFLKSMVRSAEIRILELRDTILELEKDIADTKAALAAIAPVEEPQPNKDVRQ